MLAKLTSKNQLTLPKAIISQFPGAEYFEIATESGRIVLTPARIGGADAVRAKLAQLGIVEQDAIEAVRWTRDQR